MAREIKKVITEGAVSEIVLEVVSTELVNANEKAAPNTQMILDIHNALKTGAKVVIKPAKEYINHF